LDCLRGGVLRHPCRPGGGASAGTSWQRARTAELPDAAAAARLAAALQPARWKRGGWPRADDRGCRRLMGEERRRLIVAANRAPVTYSVDDAGNRVARRGGGGLVTALRSLVTQHDVTWIASAMTDEDRAVAAEAGDQASE